MANYEGYLRSNYFAVKDETAFNTWCQGLGLEPIKNDGLIGFLGESVPSDRSNPETGEIDDIDFPAELAAHLVEGHVAIFREIGHEKMRYLVGHTLAVNAKGDTRQINLDSIYDSAKELGEHATLCEY